MIITRHRDDRIVNLPRDAKAYQKVHKRLLNWRLGARANKAHALDNFRPSHWAHSLFPAPLFTLRYVNYLIRVNIWTKMIFFSRTIFRNLLEFLIELCFFRLFFHRFLSVGRCVRVRCSFHRKSIVLNSIYRPWHSIESNQRNNSRFDWNWSLDDKNGHSLQWIRPCRQFSCGEMLTIDNYIVNYVLQITNLTKTNSEPVKSRRAKAFRNVHGCQDDVQNSNFGQIERESQLKKELNR